MKKIILLATSIFLISACGHIKNYKIKGKLTGSAKEIIYLKEMTTQDVVTIDSIKIDDAGEFKLKGKNDRPAFYMLYLSKNNYITLIIKPGEKLLITADAKDLTHTYTVKGSKDSELAKEVNDKINDALKKIEKLGQIYQDSVHSPNIMAIRANLDSDYYHIETEQREYTKTFIKNNIHSLSSIMALYQQLSPRRSVLNPTEHFEYYKMVDSVMMKTYPEADAVQSLHSLLKDLNEQHARQAEIEKRLAIGAEAPEIALPSPKGDILKLSSTHGKYVLLDFWASWCKPCRMENPNLVHVYWKYKYHGFEIFQVSLDRNKDSWTKGIHDDQLFWLHVSDLKMWDSPIVALYNIDGIPHNLLLDPDGKIIAKDLLGNDLSAKLKEIFKY